MVIEYIKAILYGIVEGITEWLPISSTGHLILLERIVSLDIGDGELAAHFRTLFDVVIQLGAILAVLVLYRKKLMPTTREARSLWIKLAIATMPAALIGLTADALCEHYFNKGLDELIFNPYVVASALVTYGILFIIVERLAPSVSDSGKAVSTRRALAIGFFQALALIPGTSRSGATILGARILNTSRSTAAEFSFFAAIPIIASASALKIFDFCKFTTEAQTAVPPDMIALLLLASAVAFAVSLVCIKFLTDFIKRHSFAIFGAYRIALGLAVFIFFKS
ncbi:MAG: undecaprenyl-diphosphate phosphatase [Clostridia bacterium]|nr:undecaprenyl-diphosphate phosphatase [Clostridia bacterium]